MADRNVGSLGRGNHVAFEMAEEIVPPPSRDVPNEALRLLAGMLAAGYLRLLASGTDDPDRTVPARHNPSIPLDSPAQQSDELD